MIKWSAKYKIELELKIKKEENISEWLVQFEDLTRLNLARAKLKGINLIQRDVSGSSFMYANLDNAKLSSVKAEGCDFRKCSFVNGYAIKGDFRGSNFRRADMRFTYFNLADLRDVDLCNVSFSWGAEYFRNTIINRTQIDLLSGFFKIREDGKNGIENKNGVNICSSTL